MQEYLGLDQVQIDEPTVLTIGKFNGMHLGHQYLLKQIVERARSLDGVSAAITFDPHPTLVLQPQHQRVYLAPAPERIALMRASGLDHLVTLRFDQALTQLTAEQFMDHVCDRINLRELWVGPEFRLGYRAHGTIDVLRSIGNQRGWSVQPVTPLEIDGARVSATRIRELLEAGYVDHVAPLLGRDFAVVGEVVKGDQRGRTIGFPTANVAVAADHLLPADGVYACRVTLPDGSEHPAVTNVGVRPTFGLLARTVEAHLIDWSGDLYGQTIRVAFVQRIRGEQKFSGIDELKAQIHRDAQRAREMLL